MPPLRVLEVLEATEGGTRTHFRDLVLGLPSARFGVEVAVSLGRDPGFATDLERFRQRGIAVHVGPMVRAINPLADARSLAWLRGLIRAGDYQIVHGHSSKAGFLARLAGLLEGVPVRLYTPNAFHFQNPQTSRVGRGLSVALERLAARWGSGLICVSAGERAAALA
ncbi:MAG: glycosyltransferase, partial [Armatimonadetes bacterium]|nr:glycosyltransferase [Armatimonadota bacterium]